QTGATIQRPRGGRRRACREGGMTDRPLWTVEAMAAAMGAASAGPLPLSTPGISIDTRRVAPGEAFFAIKGDNRDGHDFVEGALAAGGGLAAGAAAPRR